MKFDQETPVKGDGQGLFLKLKDKDSFFVLFRGEPKVFYAKYEGGKSVECGKSEHGARFRFRINALVKEGKDHPWVAKIWEQGSTIYDMLRGLNEEYPLEETVVKISRSGSGKDDTSYTILPSRNQPTEEQMSTLKNMELNQLESSKANGSSQPEDEVPF